MTDIKTLPKPLIDTIAGFFAGIASTLVGHPLDVVKTRLQSKPHLRLDDVTYRYSHIYSRILMTIPQSIVPPQIKLAAQFA